MENKEIKVPIAEIQRVANLLAGAKTSAYLHLDSTSIEGCWLFGRDDIAPRPGIIVFRGLEDQTRDSVEFAIKTVIRNMDGYCINYERKDDTQQ